VLRAGRRVRTMTSKASRRRKYEPVTKENAGL
jgi:hypothetical protein